MVGKKKLLLMFVIFFQLKSVRVHVLGDSHASFCFSNERTAIPRNEHSIYYYENGDEKIPIEFYIHWFESKTMFRIGRDGLAILNLKKMGIQENDIVVFVFGEIDARCHIGKQRDLKKRHISEIIDSLTGNFFKTIQKNRMKFEQIHCVVVSVTPPTNNAFNWVYPYHGSLEDRAEITHLLNASLEKLCEQYGFDFLNIFPLYSTPEGFLDDAHGDGVVHVNPFKNDLIKEKLVQLLRDKYALLIEVN